MSRAPQVDRIFSPARYTRKMDFTPVPRPRTTPRIEARQGVDAIRQDYERFMLLFWEFFNNLEAWRAGVDQRLAAIERRLPR